MCNNNRQFIGEETPTEKEPPGGMEVDSTRHSHKTRPTSQTETPHKSQDEVGDSGRSCLTWELILDSPDCVGPT